MSKIPQLPGSSKPVSPSGDPDPWVDLIAFLAVLTLAGVLAALGNVTAGSLAAICGALGGLYGVWRRRRLSRG
jgi:hypothetical protein